MSDPAPAPAPVPVIVESAPVPSADVPVLPPSANVSPAASVAVNFKEPAQLLSHALKVMKQVKALVDVSDSGKAAVVATLMKSAVNESSLSDEDKAVSLAWCDSALPHVVQTVELVEAEVAKVDVVVSKKCCPSSPSKKDAVAAVPVADAKKCCPSFFAKKV